ncbi:hypothetical protein, partial [Rubidibacter lacunae]|uniref:hypothetical protein n=1 Tax=Rubidibacter lacunae TaxID=582514 RepID=UPI00058C3AF3
QAVSKTLGKTKAGIGLASEEETGVRTELKVAKADVERELRGEIEGKCLCRLSHGRIEHRKRGKPDTTKVSGFLFLLFVNNSG